MDLVRRGVIGSTAERSKSKERYLIDKQGRRRRIFVKPNNNGKRSVSVKFVVDGGKRSIQSKSHNRAGQASPLQRRVVAKSKDILPHGASGSPQA